MARSEKKAKKEKGEKEPRASSRSNEVPNSLSQAPASGREQFPPRRSLISTVPTFEEFQQGMLRHLVSVPRDKVNKLLASLYESAEAKDDLERLRHGAHEDVQYHRPSRLRMSRAARMLNDALKQLQRAEEKFPEQLREIESRVECESFAFTFAQIIQNLSDAMEVATNLQLVDVGRIHPDLRTAAERKLAKRRIAGGAEAGEIESHHHPARKDSPDIDHWFIGDVASRLDKFEKSGGGRIPGYPHIISQLFRVAFKDETRTEESIRKELQHQKTHGRPSIPPDRIVVFQYLGGDDSSTT